MLAIRFISLCDIQLKLVRANCANLDQRALGRAVWLGSAKLVIHSLTVCDNG